MKTLFIMATPLARTTKYPVMNLFLSHLVSLQECGIDLSTAYTALETASERLFFAFWLYR
jgi:hypothetical protein